MCNKCEFTQKIRTQHKCSLNVFFSLDVIVWNITITFISLKQSENLEQSTQKIGVWLTKQLKEQTFQKKRLTMRKSVIHIPECYVQFMDIVCVLCYLYGWTILIMVPQKFDKTTQCSSNFRQKYCFLSENEFIV